MLYLSGRDVQNLRRDRLKVQSVAGACQVQGECLLDIALVVHHHPRRFPASTRCGMQLASELGKARDRQDAFRRGHLARGGLAGGQDLEGMLPGACSPRRRPAGWSALLLAAARGTAAWMAEEAETQLLGMPSTDRLTMSLSRPWLSRTMGIATLSPGATGNSVAARRCRCDPARQARPPSGYKLPRPLVAASPGWPPGP